MKITSNRLFKFVAVFALSALLLSSVSCTAEDQAKDAEQTVEQSAADIGATQLENTTSGTTGAIEMIEVPVFTKDIKAGEKITEADVTTKSVRADAIPSTLVKTVRGVVGKYAKIDLFKGDFAYSAKISTKATENVADSAGIEKTKNKYVDVSLFVEPNTGADLYSALQALVNANPKRTLYFPDGEYIISKPLKLSAVPTESTSIYLSDNAVIKASDSWMSDANALITVGSGDDKSQNDIVTLGSNYFIMGGTLDGNKKATGIKIDAGREILISKIKIVDAVVGINIAYGINSGSSDIDVEDIDIYGFGARSKGIVLEGYDNNVVDVRIYDCPTGISTGNGNFFRGVSVKLTDATTASYATTIGFQVNSGNNWFYSCSTENVATAFAIGTTSEIVVKDFNIRWTKAQGAETAFKVTSNRRAQFNALCSNGIIAFYDVASQNSILTGASSGSGKILDVIVDASVCDETNYKNFFYNSKTEG